MRNDNVRVSAAVMALLRRDQSVSGIADQLGVTEAQVLEWQDTFVVGGISALHKLRTRRNGSGPHMALLTTFPPGSRAGSADVSAEMAAPYGR